MARIGKLVIFLTFFSISGAIEATGFDEMFPWFEIQQETNKTPTQAYLSDYSRYMSTRNTWYFKCEKYSEMITRMMEKEREFHDTHYVFYHGQKNVFLILHDTLNCLYQYFMKTRVQDFYMLRVWYDMMPKIDVNKYIDTHEGGMPQPWTDQKEPLITRLLSVNLSLFGNTTRLKESSMQAFVAGRSYFFSDVEDLLKKVFEDFWLNDSYINDLMDCANDVKTKQGIILQIFVPKKLIDRCAYLAHRGGTPYRYAVDSGCFNVMKERHMKISPILDLYLAPAYTQPTFFQQEYDHMQARLVFSQDVMLNPKSGVTMFRYANVDDCAMQAYQERVTQIVTKACDELFATMPAREILKNKLIVKTKKAWDLLPSKFSKLHTFFEKYKETLRAS